MAKQSEFEQRIAVIDELVQRLERAPDPGLRDAARELVQALMDLHGAGLERLMEVVYGQGVSGESLIAQFGQDPLVRALLLLHGLHPVDVRTRVLEGLDKARPYLRSHGGNVELVSVDDTGAVRLRLQGSCHGCPSSSMTLKLAIEDAVREAAPDVTSILVEGEITDTAAAPVGSSGALPLVTLESNAAPRRVMPDDVVWEEILALDALPAGGVALFPASNRGLLCCRLDDTFYAYGDHCPSCGERLEAARLTGTTLHCAVCDQAYDVFQAGRGLDRPDLHLEPFPLLREHGRTRVALPIMRMASGPV